MKKIRMHIIYEYLKLNGHYSSENPERVIVTEYYTEKKKVIQDLDFDPTNSSHVNAKLSALMQEQKDRIRQLENKVIELEDKEYNRKPLKPAGFFK